MLPAQAPFPTACNFPFQPEPGAPEPCAEAAGSQTSILMSESLDGVSVAATRQNAGRFEKASAPRPPRPAGGVNCFAPTDCAGVTATWACGKVDRVSQGAPMAGAATRRKASASFMSCRATLSGSPAALKGPPYLASSF